MNELKKEVLTLDTKPEMYSVSKLKTYNTCSEYYKKKYIEKIKVASGSTSTIIGSFLHDSLEIYLSKDNSISSFLTLFEERAKETFIKKKYLIDNFDKDKFEKLYKELIDFVRDIRSLYERASRDYKGKFPIRKKDGEVAINPSNTGDWKEAEKILRLKERREYLSSEFFFISRNLDIPLVDAFSEAYTLAGMYVTPPEIIETLALEFPISDYNYETKEFTNPVLMPKEYGGEEGIYVNCYIDWVGYVEYEGKKCFSLIDYKSSQENITKNELEYHSQLLTYVYVIEKLLEKEVEVIGIHSLRHKKLVLTKVNREILEEIVFSLFSNHTDIKACRFKKHLPESIYSTCLKQYGKECPYLSNCYPNYYLKTHPESLDSQIEQLINI